MVYIQVSTFKWQNNWKDRHRQSSLMSRSQTESGKEPTRVYGHSDLITVQLRSKITCQQSISTEQGQKDKSLTSIILGMSLEAIKLKQQSE
jgi:hypothetical protein